MKLYFILLYLIIGWEIGAQDTFSIVAIDEETGEIGSAGATCLDDNDIAGGAVIISDIVVGRGAVNTQSFYLPANQAIANGLLHDGSSATEIVNSLILNDAQNNASVRQYGVVAFAGNGPDKAAAFTGDNCFDVKHQRVGPHVAVQGNILLNEGIVDSMFARFNSEAGPLHAKLMAAMQGAKVPGADSRCFNEGVSSLSAFLRVAKPDDTDDDLWMDIVVSKTPFGYDPIDSLQIKYDEFFLSNKSNDLTLHPIHIFPNPAQDEIKINFEFEKGMIVKVYHVSGELILDQKISTKKDLLILNIDQNGLYNVSIVDHLGNSLVNDQFLIQK
jgi:uncharacterized Ntn-hydrolase superfamily protein